LLSTFALNFNLRPYKLMECCSAPAKGEGVDVTQPLLQKVWTIFVEQVEDRFR